MDTASLISKALDEVLSPDTLLSDILQKVKAVGHFIGNKELKEWATRELTGYNDSGHKVPSYRKIIVVPKVDLLHSGFAYNNGRQRNQNMVIEYLDKDLKESLTNFYVGQGIKEIEGLAASGDNVSMEIPHPIAQIISEQVYQSSDWHIHRAWHEVPLNQLASLLAKVRSKLMDLLFELDELGTGASLQSFQQKQLINDTVSKALNTITAGAGSTINVSHGGTVLTTTTGDGAQLNVANGQHITQHGGAPAPALDELLQQLLLLIARDEFAANRHEMEQQVETIKVQLHKPQPKKSIISRAIESLNELAADGAGVMAGHAIFELLRKAPELLAATGIA